MFLGHDAIMERIRKQGLLENFHPEAVQGSGVDMRINKLFELGSEGLLRKDERKLPEINDVPPILEPGRYYLFVTIEKVNMPSDLLGLMLNRSSLFRCGASLRTAVVDPGYSGVLTVGIKNEGAYQIELERGARVLQMVFAEVKGGTKSYDGRYQGGKVV
jgi:deoxycytidine triphosphate deaminase